MTDDEQIHDRDCLYLGRAHRGGCLGMDMSRAEVQRHLAEHRLGDEIPMIASARLVVEFADGRFCVFDVRDPGPAEVQFEHVPRDRVLDQNAFPVDPDLLAYVPAASGVYASLSGITIRLKAARGHSISYQDSRG